MSDYYPNSFQVPNSVVDDIAGRVSAKAFACIIFIIRKTRGWHKQKDSIPVTQFKQFLCTKDERTVQKILSELEREGLIIVTRELGKKNEYELGAVFGDSSKLPTKNAGAKDATTRKKCSEPPTNNVGATTHKKCGSSKDTIQNPNTKGGACDLFIKTYPQQVKAKQIREEWTELNKQLNLDEQIDMIIADIQHRKKSDRKWKAGYSPDPLNYLKGARWNDAIDPIRQEDRHHAPGSSNQVPTNNNQLVTWADQYGYPKPRPGEDYESYRQRLHRAVAERDRQTDD